MEIKTDFEIEINEPVSKWECRECIIYGVKDKAIMEPTHIGFDIMNRKIIVLPHCYEFSARELADIYWVFPLLYAQRQSAIRKYLNQIIHDAIFPEKEQRKSPCGNS